MTSTETLINMLLDLVANLLFVLLTLTFQALRRRLDRWHPLATPVGLLAILFFYVLATLSLVVSRAPYSVYVFLLTSICLVWIIMRVISSFWRVGLVSVDRTAIGGLNQQKSLDLCTDSLEFLGIGAAKLTSAQTFEAAIQRCDRGEARPIRFLLCDPSNQELVDAAKRAGRDSREYTERVRESLRTLRRLRDGSSRRIEVRFYKQAPLFRLMFINDSLCLLSHYLLGEGDGSQLPQLHVRKAIWRRRDNESLYFPLKQYFERLWGESEPWDFRRHVE